MNLIAAHKALKLANKNLAIITDNWSKQERINIYSRALHEWESKFHHNRLRLESMKLLYPNCNHQHPGITNNLVEGRSLYYWVKHIPLIVKDLIKADELEDMTLELSNLIGLYADDDLKLHVRTEQVRDFNDKYAHILKKETL